MNRVEDATQAYEAALKLRPDSFEALIAFGNLAAKFRFFRVALTQYLKFDISSVIE